MKPIIEIKDTSKKYRFGQKEAYYSLRDSIAKSVTKPLNIFKKKKMDGNDLAEDEFWALEKVNFEVNKGEVVGVIGNNGAGKTTLLKILCRITPPTKGEIILRGRVASLLEVGTGFHPELTGRENIYLNGAILGMTQREIRKKFDEIVDFSEIEKFLDTPVKHYSSGMYMRLAFSVAAHLEPEILLVDEVLAVGDTFFQKKCLGKMEKVAKGGKTVIFVSHNISAVKQLCNKSIILDHGRIKFIGDTGKAIEKYLGEVVNIDSGISKKVFKEDINKEFQILSINLRDGEGKSNAAFSCDEPIVLELVASVHKRIPGLYGYMSIEKSDGQKIWVSDTLDYQPNCLDGLKKGKYKIKIEIPKRTIGHGNYQIYLNFTSIQGQSSFNIDSPGYVCSFSLSDDNSDRGNKREGHFSTLLKWDIYSYENEF